MAVFTEKVLTGRPHFASWHGLLGGLVLLHAIFQTILGCCLHQTRTHRPVHQQQARGGSLYTPQTPNIFVLSKAWIPSLRLAHVTSGGLFFLLSSATMCLGLISSWFTRSLAVALGLSPPEPGSSFALFDTTLLVVLGLAGLAIVLPSLIVVKQVTDSHLHGLQTLWRSSQRRKTSDFAAAKGASIRAGMTSPLALHSNNRESSGMAKEKGLKQKTPTNATDGIRRRGKQTHRMEVNGEGAVASGDKNGIRRRRRGRQRGALESQKQQQQTSKKKKKGSNNKKK
ncbi:unnamed protein product [Protopolystoma xenopodis]|uniref:Cytochrome b561 domain-containing protein n=1 Tax=Protopolystoma xenopodis TaxID=117903 RepID=A0A448WI21_9PLAT|nr:unnamed protein product [Protopolystoma xenopodis]